MVGALEVSTFSTPATTKNRPHTQRAFILLAAM